MSQVQRRIGAMEAAFPDACVRFTSDALDNAPAVPDPEDKHVVAAAIFSNAQGIVTFNLRHFPDSVLNPLGLKALSPDEFLVRLFETGPGRIADR